MTSWIYVYHHRGDDDHDDDHNDGHDCGHDHYHHGDDVVFISIISSSPSHADCSFDHFTPYRVVNHTPHSLMMAMMLMMTRQ